jgi:phosphoribosyl 1,2-cyclic phosphodiesterase
MKITFWGVRGSVSVSGPEFDVVGGHTTCLEVEADGHRLIIDAGTGLRRLGNKLANEARVLGKPVEATMLFTHLHWDHVQGFPFFGPAFSAETKLDMYGPVDDDGVSTLQDVLQRQMQPPMFPVTLDQVPAEKNFHLIEDGSELELNDFYVRASALTHPQGSLGFRIQYGGRAICFATDTEHPADGSVDEALLELARDVDLLIYDAQYTEAEYLGRAGSGPSRKGWGHSTYLAGIRTARAAGAKRLMLTHHDPSHDDNMVAAIEREARALFPACRAARETQPIAI